MMTWFNFHADLDGPEPLVAAVVQATGETDVRILKGHHGSDRVTGEPLLEEYGPVNIEWWMRRGKFRLDVSVYARDLLGRETEARFCRDMARLLNRDMLFSDCSAFPFSYFSARPDGSIWAELLVIDDDDDDRMDTQSYDHEDPRHRYPRMTFGPSEPLPPRALGDPDSWRHGDTNCETPVAEKPCRVFAMPCPKHRLGR